MSGAILPVGFLGYNYGPVLASLEVTYSFLPTLANDATEAEAAHDINSMPTFSSTDRGGTLSTNRTLVLALSVFVIFVFWYGWIMARNTRSYAGKKQWNH